MIGKINKNLIVLLFIILSVFSVNNCYAVSVGTSYGGGTVFCVSKTPDTTKCVIDKGASGDYGLIMANEDQVEYDSNPKYGLTWSSECKKTNALSLDDGASNTVAIIKAHPKDNASNNAAWLCHSYKDKIEGHTDWYLPSKNELNKIYLYAKANNLIGKNCSGSKNGGIQCLVGGYDYDMVYWSSSEGSVNFNFAWVQYFSNGSQYYHTKISGYFGLRVVRAFNKFNNLSIKQFIKNLDSELNEKIFIDIVFHFSDLDLSEKVSENLK